MTTTHPHRHGIERTGPSESSFYGPLPDPAADAGYVSHPQRMGFFTDTSICIGCKACEVACKIWNHVPDDGFDLLGMSYDNTGSLGASTWRHVAFIEQSKPIGDQALALAELPTGPTSTEAVQASVARALHELGEEASRLGSKPVQPHVEGDIRQLLADATGDARTELRWLMASDVCKHCTHAACLDVCPTGSLFRTEFGTVVVQEDICNGCGYCVPACPYGVIDQRPGDGRAWKCTLCYDRLQDDAMPACAKTCPTESIQFGPVEELRERAHRRVEQLHELGVTSARLYGENPEDGVGGDGAFFLLLDEPEVYGLPPDPVVTTRDLPAMWRRAGVAAASFLGLVATAFLTTRRAGAS